MFSAFFLINAFNYATHAIFAFLLLSISDLLDFFKDKCTEYLSNCADILHALQETTSICCDNFKERIYTCDGAVGDHNCKTKMYIHISASVSDLFQ